MPEGTLYWRVRYQVPAGWQPFTNYTSIRVDNAEPDIPDLLSPGDDCFYTDSASPGVASFYWSTVESYSPIHYGLEYSTDSTFATGGRGDSTLVDTVWTDSTFTGNYWWYWHVKATDSSGNTSGWPAIPNRAVIAAMVGDVNASHTITSADIISLTNYVFKAGPEPVPHPLVGNTDECYGPAYSCFVSAADIVVLVQYVFYGQKKPCGLPCPECCAHD